MAHGYNVILCTTGFDHTREVDYLAMIRSRAVDGLVYAAGAPPSNSQLGSLLGDLPLVLVDEEVPGASAQSFVSDNRGGGRMVAEHLLGLGHRRFVVLRADGLVSSDERLAGFSSALRDAGVDEPLVLAGAFTEQGGRDALLPHIRRLKRDHTAIFAVNDLMALGAIDELQRAGLEVPSDVSVVGFDDIMAGGYANPRLTTVHQDVTKLGYRAADALITQLDGSEPANATNPNKHVLPVSLIRRQSTAAPRRKKEELRND